MPDPNKFNKAPQTIALEDPRIKDIIDSIEDYAIEVNLPYHMEDFANEFAKFTVEGKKNHEDFKKINDLLKDVGISTLQDNKHGEYTEEVQMKFFSYNQSIISIIAELERQLSLLAFLSSEDIETLKIKYKGKITRDCMQILQYKIKKLIEDN